MFQRFKKIGAAFLAAAVVAGMFPAGALSVRAEDTAVPISEPEVALSITEVPCTHVSEGKKVLKTYTLDALKELAKENEGKTPAYIYKNGSGNFCVLGVAEYVTFEQLLADSGIDWKEKQNAGKNFAYACMADNFSHPAGYKILDDTTKEDYKFYPNASAGDRNTEGAEVVPAGLALKYGSQSVEKDDATKAADLAAKAIEAAKEGSLNGFYGTIEADITEKGDGKTMAGNRMVGGVDTVLFTDNAQLTEYPEKAATYTEAGNIAYWECTVCKTKFSDKKGKVRVENVAIPKLEKKEQSIKVSPASKTIKAAKLSKSKVKVTLNVTDSQGKITAKSSSKNITAKVSGKKIIVTVAKGTKKGNYTVTVTAAATEEYNASKAAVCKIKVS